MKTSTPPPPPDPTATANAQTASNKATAITQYGLNATNQTTPYGKLTYSQVGTWADGTPRFEATTTLSPEEQRNQDQQWEFDRATNNLGIEQTKRLQGILGTPFAIPEKTGALAEPFTLNNEATESRLMELGRKRLDPVQQQNRAALEQKLANQGFAPGSEGWNRALTEFGQQENDAYNQLLLTGRSQAANEISTERNQNLTERDKMIQELLLGRNQPINETTALMSGGQVTMPQFTNTPQTNVAGTDVAGLTMDAYKAGPLAQYQAQQQQNQAMMSGLFGLGGAALGGWGAGAFKKAFA